MKKPLLSTIVLLFFCLSITSQVPSYVATSGLVGWWPFNGNANDESGNGNNGSVVGATLTVDRLNNANKAYLFNGTGSYITSSPSNLPLNNSPLSISAWFNLASYPVNTSIGVVSWGQWTTNNARYIGFRQGATNQLTYANYYNDIDCSFSYSLNTWYHYVVTYSNNIVKFYINSNLNGVFSIASANTLNGSLYFGSSAGLTDYFPGKLDDIGVWNRALDSTEILKLFEAKNINTGIGSLTLENAISIFPNPTQGYFTVACNNDIGNYRISIHDVMGKEIFQTVITEQLLNLDLTFTEAKGVYFVHITNAQGQLVTVKKIVLQ